MLGKPAARNLSATRTALEITRGFGGFELLLILTENISIARPCVGQILHVGVADGISDSIVPVKTVQRDLPHDIGDKILVKQVSLWLERFYEDFERILTKESMVTAISRYCK